MECEIFKISGSCFISHNILGSIGFEDTSTPLCSRNTSFSILLVICSISSLALLSIPYNIAFLRGISHLSQARRAGVMALHPIPSRFLLSIFDRSVKSWAR